jgi:translation initiation factor 4G
MIHLSFSREDVKLRETENAWKPRRLVQGSASEEQTKIEALYKRVRSVLNKLTPQKFSTLVNQVRELEIDTQEKLQGVIDLVFEKVFILCFLFLKPLLSFVISFSIALFN